MARAAAEKDPAARADRLAPFLLVDTQWNIPSADKVEALLVEIGAAAAPALLKLWREHPGREPRSRIADLWGRGEFPSCVEPLIAELNQELARPSDASSKAPDQSLQAIRGLARNPDPRAKSVLEKTCDRLVRADPVGLSFVADCDRALEAIAALAEKR